MTQTAISHKLKIEVEDHGKEVSERDQEQIFYRIYAAVHKGSGSGLGLTIAKTLALQMEADIQLASEPGEKPFYFGIEK